MKFRYYIYSLFCISIFVASCSKRNDTPNPWGATAETINASSSLQLDDIISNGELIMVTMTGPETYYEYHGRGMGLHYLLCEKFCETIGVSLRVDVCKDSADMYERVRRGEADIIAMPFTRKVEGLLPCSDKTLSQKWHWFVNSENTTLADSLSHWLTEDMVAMVQGEEAFLFSTRSVKRHVYSPMLNRSAGVISNYDHLFQKYASTARWDWRLLAAQCYQESTFDPQARSWVGAAGLMQIMPSTADELGLARSDIYDPEKNVAAAARYIAMLSKTFGDVPNLTERMKFVLASYNGGAHHVRDAMALAQKNGKSAYRWTDVREYILCLQKAEYYNDPVVKSGYMRGSETADYVDRIWNRWLDYRGVKSTEREAVGNAVVPADVQPHPSAKRKEKYNL